MLDKQLYVGYNKYVLKKEYKNKQRTQEIQIMNNNTTKALIATIEREHYDDVAVVMVSADMASKMNLEAVKNEIHKLYAGKCLTSKVEIMEQNTDEYKNKMKDYMFPENLHAVQKLQQELGEVAMLNM